MPPATAAPLRLLFAASECWPLVKTGGLADVAYALPLALTAQHVDVRVTIPAYRGLLDRLEGVREVASLPVLDQRMRVFEGRLPGTPLTFWLVDEPNLYARAGDPYRDELGRDHPDNAWRFGCFSEAVARLALGAAGWQPDVVHANDWQTGPALSWLAALPGAAGPRPKRVFTIHNLAYQGWYGRDAFDYLRLPESLWQLGGVEMYGGFNFMKSGITAADVITTVSPTYAREIQTPAYGHGLDGLLRWRGEQLVGICNGVDTQAWDPRTDPLLVRNFGEDDLVEGKRANKRALQQELALREDIDAPVIGVVSRLAQQKGTDLIIGALDALMHEQTALQFAVLASGDRGEEDAWRRAAARYPGRIALSLRYDERLAHRIEAGADLFAMPSRFEPCGLNQMYSQRYATVPVVRRTGGLADTVADITPENLAAGTATGVHFADADVGGVLWGLRRALQLRGEPKAWRALQLAGMRRDFSWDAAASQYRAIYA